MSILEFCTIVYKFILYYVLHYVQCSRELVVGPLRIACINRSEEHTSELQSLRRISYAVFCLKKKGYKKVYREGRCVCVCVCVGWWRFLSTGPRELNYCYYILYIINLKIMIVIVIVIVIMIITPHLLNRLSLCLF